MFNSNDKLYWIEKRNLSNTKFMCMCASGIPKCLCVTFAKFFFFFSVNVCVILLLKCGEKNYFFFVIFFDSNRFFQISFFSVCLKIGMKTFYVIGSSSSIKSCVSHHTHMSHTTNLLLLLWLVLSILCFFFFCCCCCLFISRIQSKKKYQEFVCCSFL